MRFVATKKMAWVVVLAMLALLGSQLISQPLGLPATSTALAQDENKEGGEAKAPEEGAKTDEAGGGQATQNKGPKNLLVWFFSALGVRYVLAFGIISFSFVAILVMNILSMRRDSVCPKHLADAFEAHLNEKRFQEAYDLAKNDESFLGQMLAAGMQNLQQGYDKSQAAMAAVGAEEGMRLDQRLSYISLIGTISPMVGLLGTVDGMVASFMEIAGSDSTPKPSKLAEGISTALITTLVGLVLAIPAILAFNLIKNRLAWLTMEVEQKVTSLMGRFEGMAAKK